MPGDDWYEDWDEKDWHILPSLARPLYKKNLHHPQLRVLTGVNRDEAAKMVCEYYKDIYIYIYISIIYLRCLSVCVSLNMHLRVIIVTWDILMKVKDEVFCPFLR